MTFSEAIDQAKSSIIRFPLIPIRGIPLMSYIAQNWDSIWAFRPDPSDLLIATYPKAGKLELKLHLQILTSFCQTLNFDSESLHMFLKV